MITYTTLEETDYGEDTAVALGNFDGVHKGHQKLIRSCVSFAGSHALCPAVFTFSNHPRNLLSDRASVKNILYRDEKAAIMENLGVEYMVEVPFTREIMEMEPEEFITEFLLKRMRMKAAFCGFNYRFGHSASGTPDVLREAGKKYGFSVHEMKPYILQGNVVSSTLVRTLIASGRVDECMRYMGRNYEVAGEVVVGNRLGRRLGFPTSNLVIDPQMVTPPNGVYITYCDYNGVRYPSITNVGVKPTVGDNEKNVETHIFDFNRELYGKTIIVEFLKKLRDEVKFDSVEDLSEQIVRDCKEARKYHEKSVVLHGPSC